MKAQKVKNYLLTGSIHTVTIVVYGKIIEIPKETLPEKLRDCVDIQPQNGNTYIFINPNKLNGDLFTFSEFQDAMNEIIEALGIEKDKYYFRRVDFRLDSYDPDFFDEYKKLHRYIISTIFCKYKTTKDYETHKIIEFEDTKSICFKNEYFEIEYYNRDLKNKETGNTTEPAKARLELRAKAKNIYPGWTMDNLKNIFTVDIINRLTKSIENYEYLQIRENDFLQKIFIEDQKQTEKLRMYYSISDFINKHREYFYQTSQLEEFLSRFPELIENPKRRAYKLSTGKIETISKTNLEDIVSKIKKNMRAFFKG